jgi:hypothetical protein
MKGRLAKYHLTLNEEKTHLVPFSIPVHHQGDKPGMFEFLGFTFYWGQSPQGTAIPKVKTSGRRLRGKLKRVNQWAQSARPLSAEADLGTIQSQDRRTQPLLWRVIQSQGAQNVLTASKADTV